MSQPTDEVLVKILEIAANQGLPKEIHANNDIAQMRFFDMLYPRHLKGQRLKNFGESHHYENLQITPSGLQMLKELTKTENIDAATKVELNINHSSIAVGNGNKVSHKSSQKTTTNTTATKTAKLSGVIIKIISGVAIGLIVWYLTH